MLNYSWYVKASWGENGLHAGGIEIGNPKTVSLPISKGVRGTNNSVLVGVGFGEKQNQWLRTWNIESQIIINIHYKPEDLTRNIYIGPKSTIIEAHRE